MATASGSAGKAARRARIARPRPGRSAITPRVAKRKATAARHEAPAPVVLRDLVVIGGSGGGIEALSAILGALPAHFPAAVVAVIHRSDRGPNALVGVLKRQSALTVLEAQPDMHLQHGHVYLPPTDHHVLVDSGRLCVSRAPKENHVRPAIDPLFRSAARTRGPGTIGVILTGSLDDGTAGLLAVKRRGGVTIVQDPAEALFPDMPRSACEHVDVDHLLPLADIAGRLVALAGSPVPGRPGRREGAVGAFRAATFRTPGGEVVEALTCPSCGGALREIEDGDVLRFACHTGHRFGLESLASGQEDDIEAALWGALRALNEKAALVRRMSERARGRGLKLVAKRHGDSALALEHQIETLRALIQRM